MEYQAGTEDNSKSISNETIESEYPATDGKRQAHWAAKNWMSTVAVLSTLFLGILIGTLITHSSRAALQNMASDATPLTMPSPTQLSNQFSTIAKQIEPTVVNISTDSTIKMPTRNRRGAPNGNNDDNGDMQDFFDRFFGGGGQGQIPDGAREHALGSGVIMDPKGYIITNAHVVGKADRIRVKLMDSIGNEQYDAKVIGVDEETDVAVIKIDAKKPLPYARMGNSESMNVGDWVLAIGSPFGLDETVTAGIISSKGRSIDRTRQFQNFLQTDAAINPGNSGGPLVNMAGEVIGINTAIITQSSGYQGVGFALPSKIAVNIYNQLIAPGNKVTRGSIGVTFNATESAQLRRQYGEGVTISGVSPDTPADAAGLKIYDTITAVDGKKVANGDELVAEISSHKPGSKVKLTVIRDGKTMEFSCGIEDRTKLVGTANNSDSDDEDSDAKPTSAKLGVSVRNITPDIAERFNVTANKGLLVTDVKAGSFAEDLGLNRNDVILEVNRQPVNSEDAFRKIQSSLKSGSDVVVLVHQGRGKNGGTNLLTGTLP